MSDEPTREDDAGDEPTPAKSTNEQRRKPSGDRRGIGLVVRTVVVVVVLVAGWMAVLVGAQVLQRGKTYSFREETLRVLKLMREGRSGADKLYNEASPLLRKAMIRSVFIDVVEEVRNVMGQFQQVKKVLEAQVNSRANGTTGWVTAEVEFSQATTTATFSFHKVDGQWRFLHFQVDLPPHRILQAKRKDSLLAPKTAPEAVHKLVRQIMESRVQGTTEQVYAHFHSEFKRSVSLDKFRHLLNARADKLGTFRRVLEVRNSSMNKDKTSASVDAVLQYTEHKTIASFSFKWQEGEWRLYYFKIFPPDPGALE